MIQIFKENFKEVIKNYTKLLTPILWALFCLLLTASFFFLTIYSANTGFDYILGICLVLLCSFGLLNQSITALDNFIVLFRISGGKYGDFQSFSSSLKAAYVAPTRKCFSLWRELFYCVIIFFVFGSIILTIGLNIAYNTNPDFKLFYDNYISLQNSGASLSTLFDYYLANGNIYDEALKIVNVCTISVLILFIFHSVSKKFIFFVFSNLIQMRDIPHREKRHIFYSSTRFSSVYLKHYYGLNYPYIIAFYLSYIVSVVLLSFYNNSYLFILGASTLIAGTVGILVSPFLIYNSFDINGIMSPSYKTKSGDLVSSLMHKIINDPNINNKEKAFYRILTHALGTNTKDSDEEIENIKATLSPEEREEINQIESEILATKEQEEKENLDIEVNDKGLDEHDKNEDDEKK